jgi:hypothetical protein
LRSKNISALVLASPKREFRLGEVNDRGVDVRGKRELDPTLECWYSPLAKERVEAGLYGLLYE